MNVAKNLSAVKARVGKTHTVRYWYDIAKVGKHRWRVTVKRKDGDLCWVVFVRTCSSYRRVRPGDVRWIDGRANAHKAGQGVIRAQQVIDEMRRQRLALHSGRAVA